jgi:hypothetical protein
MRKIYIVREVPVNAFIGHTIESVDRCLLVDDTIAKLDDVDAYEVGELQHMQAERSA